MIWLFKQKKEYRWIEKVKGMLRNLWYGFRTVLTMKQKTRFIIYTVLLWTCYYLQLYFCIFAFPIRLIWEHWRLCRCLLWGV